MDENRGNRILLRVVISDDSIHKFEVNTNEVTEIESLKALFIKAYGLKSNIELQYRDKDFNEYFTLNNMKDLYNLCSVKVIQKVSEAEVKVEVKSEASAARWPSTFDIPCFDTDICVFLKNTENSFNTIPSKIRKKIVGAIANEILKFTAYPTSKDIKELCFKVVEKYPVLRDGGGGGGSETWVLAVKFKMGNLRKTLKNDLPEVSANTGKKSKAIPEAPTAHTEIKKIRRGVVERFPETPIGENTESLKDLKEQIKTEPDRIDVTEKMSKSWSLRWKDIFQGTPTVKDILLEWPAYKDISMVYCDFRRLTNINLPAAFIEGMDHVLEKLGYEDTLTLDQKRNRLIEQLEKLCNSNLIVPFEDEDTDEDHIIGINRPMYVATYDGTFYIVIENNLVSFVDERYRAYSHLMAYLWVFNLHYPADSKYMFEFLEKYILEIDTTNKSCKVLSIYKKLMKNA